MISFDNFYTYTKTQPKSRLRDGLNDCNALLNVVIAPSVEPLLEPAALLLFRRVEWLPLRLDEAWCHAAYVKRIL